MCYTKLSRLHQLLKCTLNLHIFNFHLHTFQYISPTGFLWPTCRHGILHCTTTRDPAIGRDTFKHHLKKLLFTIHWCMALRQVWCLLQVKLCDPCLSTLYHTRRYTSAQIYLYLYYMNILLHFISFLVQSETLSKISSGLNKIYR